MTSLASDRATDDLLHVNDLTIELSDPGGRTCEVVSGVTLEVRRGETLGIVGESGSGKSLTAAALLDLLPPRARRTSGSIVLAGESLHALEGSRWQRLRGGRIGLVFQDSLSAFNPVRTIGAQLAESAVRHGTATRRSAAARVIETLRAVGLQDPQLRAASFPHQLSGGQRQRCMIALALINDPVLLIADEPTTALDATVQQQIIALLRLGASRRATILITHDLAVAAQLCTRIAVMYHGRIVETASTRTLLTTPRHPYTRALLDLAPDLEADQRLPHAIPGAPPSPFDRMDGCSFQPRCSRAIERCAQRPALVPDAYRPSGATACWNPVPPHDSSERA